MSDYYIANPNIQPGPVTQTFSAIPTGVQLGMEVDGLDRAAATSGGGGAGKFVFCRGSNMAASGEFVHIWNGSAVLLAAGNSASNFPIGVGAAALTATNVYGWVQVQGRVDYGAHTNTAITAGIPLYICAGTPGIVLSNAVAGNRIQGLNVPYNQTVTATSVRYVYDLNRPFVAGVTAGL